MNAVEREWRECGRGVVNLVKIPQNAHSVTGEVKQKSTEIPDHKEDEGVQDGDDCGAQPVHRIDRGETFETMSEGPREAEGSKSDRRKKQYARHRCDDEQLVVDQSGRREPSQDHCPCCG